MRKAGIFLIVLTFILGTYAMGGELSSRFYKDIAGFFSVDEDSVAAIGAMGIVDDELAVVFFISQHTGTSPEKIANLRLRKDKWNDINKVRGASAEDFYFPILTKVTSNIYSPIFKKYRDTKEEDWKKIVFSDEEIINLINLRVISKHHGYSVFEVMAMRDMGKGFAKINNDIADLKLKLLQKEKEEKIKKKKKQSDDSKK